MQTKEIRKLESDFDQYNPYLLRVLAGYGILDEHADEVVQEVWIAALAQPEAFQARSTYKTFLTGILINKIRERARSIRRFELKDDSEKVYKASFDNTGHWIREDRDPGYWLENSELRNHLKTCIQGLTDQQMAVFTLLELEDMKPVEICESLKIPISHLRVLIFRAKDKLKQCLAKISGTDS